MMVHGAMIVFLAGCTTLVNIDVDYGIESYAENTKDFEQVETIGFTAQAENKR